MADVISAVFVFVSKLCVHTILWWQRLQCTLCFNGDWMCDACPRTSSCPLFMFLFVLCTLFNINFSYCLSLSLSAVSLAIVASFCMLNRSVFSNASAPNGTEEEKQICFTRIKITLVQIVIYIFFFCAIQVNANKARTENGKWEIFASLWAKCDGNIWKMCTQRRQTKSWPECRLINCNQEKIRNNEKMRRWYTQTRQEFTYGILSFCLTVFA